MTRIFRVRTSYAVAAMLAALIGLGQGASANDRQIAMVEPVSLLPQQGGEVSSDAGQGSYAGRPIVAMPGDHPAGTIVVVNKERRLYLSIGNGEAISYPVAIGKPGRTFSGEERISRKVKNPGWTPTPNIRREHPELPAYVPPGPNNPLGPRALYLGDGFYRIHGTNKPESIGKAASSGCVRMYNKDVTHLFPLVEVGARVIIQ